MYQFDLSRVERIVYIDLVALSRVEFSDVTERVARLALWNEGHVWRSLPANLPFSEAMIEGRLGRKESLGHARR